MSILLNDRACRMLSATARQNGKTGINVLGKGIYATYKSRYDTLVELEKLKLVEFEKSGREVIVRITGKGEETLDHLESINNINRKVYKS